MDHTLYELGVKLTGQKALIDMLTEDAPVIATIPMYPTTHGLYNVYEKLVDVDAISQMDFDSAYSEVGMKTELAQVDLAKFGGEMSVGRDALRAMYPGMTVEEAAIAYFTSKLPKIAKKTGQSIDFSVIYNFIRAKAHLASKLIDAGGSNNANYTMLCVRWENGENGGLYDPSFKSISNLGDETSLIDFTMMNDGKLHEITKGTQTIPGFKGLLDTFFSIQLANTNYLSGIKNIDLDLNAGVEKAPPTNKMVNQMVRTAKARGNNSFIYCHAAVRDYLAETYKASLVRTAEESNGRRIVLEFWNDIPIITSENFSDGAEANL